MTCKLRRATMEEAPRCYAILDNGRTFQRQQGFVQWDDAYPTMEMIEGDIAEEKGYVLTVDEELAGFMRIDFDGEPAYDGIEGRWATKEPYVVVHRMALDEAFRNRGLTDVVFQLVERLCKEKGVESFRVDTHFPNKRMQHVLEKNGFTHRGTIRFQGGERMAYDKSLT